MDWTALWLSMRLAGWTVVALLPVAIVMGRFLAYRQFRGKGLVEALVMLPLVLPPTVFGFYLLVAFGRNSPVGDLWQIAFRPSAGLQLRGARGGVGHLQSAVRHPARATRVRGGPAEVREAASCCGMSPLRALWKVELPLAWPGLMTAMVLTFAHTLGRVRHRADGRWIDPRRDQDHRHRDL